MNCSNPTAGTRPGPGEPEPEDLHLQTYHAVHALMHTAGIFRTSHFDRPSSANPGQSHVVYHQSRGWYDGRFSAIGLSAESSPGRGEIGRGKIDRAEIGRAEIGRAEIGPC
jgi:hypothetical protein